MLTVSFACLAILMQLGGAYLRYLPFRSSMSPAERRRLWKFLLAYSFAAFGMVLLLVEQRGLSFDTYKQVFVPGWLPYVAIAALLIRRSWEKHVFVCGMQALWGFMLHAFAGMGVSLLYGGVTAERLPVNLALCLVLFALSFPYAKKIFTGLSAFDFPKDPALRLCVTFLPLGLLLNALLPVVRVTFLPDWGSRLTRLFIPVFFFLIYSVAAEVHRRTAEQRALILANLRMEKRRNELLRQARAMEEHARRLSVLRHDLRHDYRLIYALLEAGDDENARRHIRAMMERFEGEGERAEGAGEEERHRFTM